MISGEKRYLIDGDFVIFLRSEKKDNGKTVAVFNDNFGFVWEEEIHSFEKRTMLADGDDQ